MEADIGTICISAEGEQGGMRLAPSHSPLPPVFSCETALYKFRKTQNFDEIILNIAKFCKIRGKFHET